MIRRVLAGVGLVMSVAVAPAAARTPTRYSLQGGCYALLSAATERVLPGAERVRMQATGLGSYLLYTPERTFLGGVAAAAGLRPQLAPSPATDWRVREAGDGTFAISPKALPAEVSRVRFAPAAGCAT